VRLVPRLLRVLHGVDRRLPPSVRRTLRQLPGRRRDGGSPLVSVVVATSDRDARWLGACLDSLRAQSHRRLEVLVMTEAADGAAARVAGLHAAGDWRVRPLEGSGGHAAALNLGAALARGEYLCFVDPRDVVPASGIQQLLESLERSGSDLAVGRATRLPAQRGVESAPDPAHDSLRQGATIGDFPLAVTDTGVGNRLFRTSFWRQAGLSFSADRLPTSHLLAFEAFVAAGTFDMLPGVTYHELHRAAGVPFGAVADTMSRLDGWLAEQRETQATLHGVEAAGVRDAWAYVVCDSWAIPFVDDAERASQEQWRALREFLQEVVAAMGPRSWDRVRAESKVKVWLVTADRRERLEEFLSRRWFEFGNRPTQVTDGVVHALLPFYREPDPGVPDSCFTMTEDETPLNCVLRSVRWNTDGALELGLHTYIDFVGHGDHAPLVEAVVVDRAGRRTPAAVRQHADSGVNVTAGHRYQDYSQGACTVTVDPAPLVRQAEIPRGPRSGQDRAGGPAWWVELRVVARGVERRGPITRSDGRGSAGRLGSSLLSGRVVEGHRIVLRQHPEHGLEISALPALDVALVDAQVRGRHVSGTLHSGGGRLRSVVARRSDGLEARGRLEAAPSGGWRFDLRLPGRAPSDAGDGAPVAWALHAVALDRNEHPIGFPSAPDTTWLGAGPDSAVLVGADGTGACELVESSQVVVLDGITVEEGSFRVTGSWPGAVPDDWQVSLRNRRLRLPAEATVRDGARFEATLPARCDEWGLGATALPSGLYFVDVRRGAGAEASPVRVVLSAAAADQLLESTTVEDFRAMPVCHGHEPGLRLSPPLARDERGAHAQKQLQEWYRDADLPLDPNAVYLQSYTGTAATDSQRAIHDELRRTRPELTVYWAVADRSTAVPPGGVPVLIHSREWYRVLATARYLCNNIDFDRWFRKRPGQTFLQTFHGYPAKSMGIRLWEAKHFTPRRIEMELDRTSRGWDLILTPAPEMDVEYRREYRYDGPIESAGYPRDDSLVSAAAAEIRDSTRARLGIDPGHTAVLYAPTWRDDLATSYRSAPMVRHLDLETASERLGPEYVFLMRGHRFHAKGSTRAGRSARLIDVTDYPEVNDLILAADAAVLDYSSMRFDFALTGNPMLFLVPDLREYTGGVRGFLFPFEQSAPGPLIRDATEVVDRLRELKQVREQYAEEYDRFNARFNYLQDGNAAARVVRRFFV
jgi:CDP-glycerol glycerophosphotransferase